MNLFNTDWSLATAPSGTYSTEQCMGENLLATIREEQRKAVERDERLAELIVAQAEYWRQQLHIDADTPPSERQDNVERLRLLLLATSPLLELMKEGPRKQIDTWTTEELASGGSDALSSLKHLKRIYDDWISVRPNIKAEHPFPHIPILTMPPEPVSYHPITIRHTTTPPLNPFYPVTPIVGKPLDGTTTHQTA